MLSSSVNQMKMVQNKLTESKDSLESLTPANDSMFKIFIIVLITALTFFSEKPILVPLTSSVSITSNYYNP